MDEDALTFGFLITSVAVFITGLVWQGLWSLLFAMTMSGNLFYEMIGVAGFLLSLVGALVLLYCALILLVYIFIFALVFGIPAYLVYLALGLENSIILAVIIGIVIPEISRPGGAFLSPELSSFHIRYDVVGKGRMAGKASQPS